MSQPPSDLTDDLQFNVAEPTTAAPRRACAGCKRPIVGTYYAVGDKLVCPSCQSQLNAPPPGRPVGRMLKATLFGLGAGLVGAVVWFGLRRLAHLEIGYVALLVGFFVGKGVLKGSGGRGGRGYQVLAVLLTYCCIAANYMPDVLEGFAKVAREHGTPTSVRHDATAGSSLSGHRAAHATTAGTTTGPSDANDASAPTTQKRPGIVAVAVALVFLAAIVFGLSLAAPFLAGAQNLIGLLIIGIALFEAWKLTARRRLPITGPYQFGDGGSGPLAAPGGPR